MCTNASKNGACGKGMNTCVDSGSLHADLRLLLADMQVQAYEHAVPKTCSHSATLQQQTGKYNTGINKVSGHGRQFADLAASKRSSSPRGL
jgi:hypothetical protein